MKQATVNSVACCLIKHQAVPIDGIALREPLQNQYPVTSVGVRRLKSLLQGHEVRLRGLDTYFFRGSLSAVLIHRHATARRIVRLVLRCARNCAVIEQVCYRIHRVGDYCDGGAITQAVRRSRFALALSPIPPPAPPPVANTPIPVRPAGSGAGTLGRRRG